MCWVADYEEFRYDAKENESEHDHKTTEIKAEKEHKYNKYCL